MTFNDNGKISGQWMKLTDAARVLAVSEITLRRKIKSGKLPFEIKNGKYFIYLGEVGEADYPVQPQSSPAKEVTSPAKPEKGARMPTLSPRGARQTEAFQNQRALPSHRPGVVTTPPLRPEDFRRELQKKEAVIKDLRRTVEDQQTLIAFLEETINQLASTKK